MQIVNRLKAVQRFLQLEISREEELQDIVVLAAEICDTPIALITLMEDDMQWIKFKIGTDFTQNTRENSFCQHLIGKEEVLVIPDTLQDERFIHHPLVEGDTNVRFYAGAPLNSHDGHHIGTLCVFDNKPHLLTEKQQKMLSILSKQVIHLMELELSVQLLKEHVDEMEGQKLRIETSETKLRSFLDSSKACHILVGKNLEVLDFNQAASVFLKNVYCKDVQVGMMVTDYVSSTFKDVFVTVLPMVMQGMTQQMEKLVDYGTQGKIWWEITFSPAYNSAGDVMGISITSNNINDQKLFIEKITAQNEVLTRIAHVQSHEFRKPVASILGLMNVIKEDNYCDNRECLIMMEAAVNELDEKIHQIVQEAQLIPALAN